MRMRMLRGWLLVAVLIAGCGGSIVIVDGGTGSTGQVGQVGQDDGGDDSSAPSGSSSGGPGVVDVCPQTLPRIGDPCGEQGQGCAYILNGNCVPVVCDGTGHWHGVAAGTGC
jgi:hypothetical protein